VTGKPMFGMDYDPEGALVAMIVHPPAFGLKVKSVDEASVKSMPGIKDVVVIKVLEDGYERNSFDVTSFTELVAIVGNTTWEVMNAKQAGQVEWEGAVNTNSVVDGCGGKQTVKVPSELVSTVAHKERMAEMAK